MKLLTKREVIDAKAHFQGLFGSYTEHHHCYGIEHSNAAINSLYDMEIDGRFTIDYAFSSMQDDRFKFFIISYRPLDPNKVREYGLIEID